MKRSALLFFSFVLSFLITACGGGGGGSKPDTSPSPVPATSTPATSTPTTSASSASTTSAPNSSAATSVTTSLSSTSSSSSVASIASGPAGVLWHDNYALDYREGVQLAHLDGSAPTQISTRSDVDVSAWPDGAQYVITDWNVYDDYTEITVIDRASGNTIYQKQVDGYLRSVKPSPTNKSVMKVRLGKDSISPFDEFILDLSNNSVRYIISERDWFSWMPDGRFMLINIDTGNIRILTLPNASTDKAEETTVGHLTVPDDRFMGDFNVSPTGKQIIMIMNRRGTTSAEPDLWIGNIDGSAFEQLTETKLIASAAWSPDGHYVAYTTDTGSICSFGGCLGSCDQWYTPVNLRKVQGLPNTPGSEVFRVVNRYGDEQTLGCSVLAWTP